MPRSSMANPHVPLVREHPQELTLNYDDFFRAATGFESPFPHQRAVAEEGLPSLLEADTGTGKTEAIVLGWLWRRRLHEDPSVRAGTPRKLVFALPMRVLVEQTVDRLTTAMLRLSETGTLRNPPRIITVMGGLTSVDDPWQANPEGDAVLIGTVDMLLSRALNRGYVSSRWTWPIAFGYLNNDVHWVFDEIQLLGPALPTSVQLQAFRDAFATVGGSSTTWMSATVDTRTLQTVDSPHTARDSVVRIDSGGPDNGSELTRRLSATRTISELPIDPTDSNEVADALLREHLHCSATLAVVNTVKRAVDIATRLRKVTAKMPEAPTIHILHSRFRPGERRVHTDSALAAMDSPQGPGCIVVATQVIEAGVDVSCRTLYTESAPWASIVQRAGRCNRRGEFSDARILWAELEAKRSAPYDEGALERTTEVLRRIEGTSPRTADMAALDPETDVLPPVLPLLRRRDLLELFTTGVDLSGNDLDVGRFIRIDEERQVSVFWRELEGGVPLDEQPPPWRDELVGVPIADLRKVLDNETARGWIVDPLTRHGTSWVRVRGGELRPSLVVMLSSDDGLYDPDIGWNPRSRAFVDEVPQAEATSIADNDKSVGDDPATVIGRPVRLADHLDDVAECTSRILEALDLDGLSPLIRNSALEAARLHDLGKAHPAFQNALYGTAASDGSEARGVSYLSGGSDTSDTNSPSRPILAKSGGSGRLVYDDGTAIRRGFRHELVSLLMLESGQFPVSVDADPDLVAYLVAAHHGRIRETIRGLPSDLELESRLDRRPAILGVAQGDLVQVPDLTGSADTQGDPLEIKLDLQGVVRGDDSRLGWSDRALALRDRADLGPFRLAFLEMVVRLGDWRASALERDGEMP